MKTLIQVDKSERLLGVTALAKRCGVSKCHMSLVLHGQRKPGPELAKKLKRLKVYPQALH